MCTPEDLVWNTITDSAKTRFDYSTLKSSLSQFDPGTMAENVLFMTILGHVQEQSVDQIASDIHQQFLLFGLLSQKDQWCKFVADRLDDLQLEIKAADQAVALFEMGLKPPGVLVQVRSILQQ